MLARQLNIFDAVLSPSIMHCGSRTDRKHFLLPVACSPAIGMCVLWLNKQFSCLSRRSAFSVTHKLLNSVAVCLYAKVSSSKYGEVKELQNSLVL